MDQIIVFGEDWGSHPSSTQHLMKHLSKNYQLVWVNSLGLRRPKLTLRDGKRAWGKLKSMMQQRHTSEQTCEMASFPVIEPKVIPWPSNPLARLLNGRLLKKRLTPVIPNDTRPILWTSLPSAVDVVGKLNEKAVIYYCGDDFSSLAGVDHEAVTKMEEELVTKADLILVASDALGKKFPPEKTIVLTHGVDYEHFAHPIPETTPRPSDLKEGRPIVGFYGSIAEWIDTEMIARVAKKLPDWEFVFIGPVQTDISELMKITNVSFLGPKPHHELPIYAAHWQVSWLPFKQCGQIDACNPLKLREYLALGKPIVTADFPALAPYQHLVHAAHDTASFVAAIETAAYDVPKLTESTSPMYDIDSWLDVAFLASNRLIRKNSVSRESWVTKAQQVHQLIGLL